MVFLSWAPRRCSTGNKYTVSVNITSLRAERPASFALLCGNGRGERRLDGKGGRPWRTSNSCRRRTSCSGAAWKSRWARNWPSAVRGACPRCTIGGQSAIASGLIDRVKASLDAAGVEHAELGGVRPNPEIGLVREGRRAVQGARTSTGFWPWAAARSSTRQRPSPWARTTKATCGTSSRRSSQTNDVLPIAVVLTIPAAGSEASKNTVVSNDELGLKSGYPNNAQRPKLAFMNPGAHFHAFRRTRRRRV